MAECDAPGVSVAKVALSHGINASIVHGWRKLARQGHARQKHPLGELFSLPNFAVNLTRLAPGAVSALLHAHTLRHESVYILKGNPTLHTDEGRTRLAPGMCAGIRAGSGNDHRLVNESSVEVVYLEIRDRVTGDQVSYPDDDLQARLVGGQRVFEHKDGTPY